MNWTQPTYEMTRPSTPNVDIMTNDVRLHFRYLWIRKLGSQDKWQCTYEKLREDVDRRVKVMGIEAYLAALDRYETSRSGE